jgi:hypothetical protein
VTVDRVVPEVATAALCCLGLVDDPEPLAETAWGAHLDLMRSSYRRWVFYSGCTCD